MGKGILQRPRARAFVWRDAKDKKQIIAFVSLDGGQNSDQINPAVVKMLNDKFPGVFSIKNVMISVTHSHSGPGGYETNVLQFTSFGFIRQTFDSWVIGAYRAIKRAYEGLEPATTKLSKGTLFGANINR